MKSKRWLKRGAYGIAGLMVLLIGMDSWITQNARQRLFISPEALPAHEVGVVLGTSPRTPAGRTNLYFRYRIDAAARLYHAGKVRHLLVSGDNHRRDYNEPAYMRAALMRKGVPDSAITLDYAGFRTLDSVVRCRKVFGRRKVVIISQPFHNERALFLADAFGLEAIGFNAQAVSWGYDYKTRLREVLARLKAILDVYILDTQPHFLGKPEPIRVG